MFLMIFFDNLIYELMTNYIFPCVNRLISDLVVVIVSATCGGIAFACAGQPVLFLHTK